MARYDQNNNPYSWMPVFLRRFLNLDYDAPQETDAGPRSAGYASASAAAARPATPWSTPSEPTFQASSMETYVPPASGGFIPPSASASFTPPPAQTPYSAAGDASAAPSIAPAQGSVDIISITQAMRGFIHGTLPPQGIEAFTKEALGTANSVWDMYTRWIGFQTGDVVKAGWGVIKAIGGLIPTGSAPAAPARRIKVMIANGDQETNGIKIEP